jgi:hypothetical protein
VHENTTDGSKEYSFPIEWKRFAQFVDYNDLSDVEKGKDLIPLTTWRGWVKLGQLDVMKSLLDGPVTLVGGRRPEKRGAAKSRAATASAWKATGAKHTGSDGVPRAVYTSNGRRAVKRFKTVKGVRKAVYTTIHTSVHSKRNS